MTRVPSSFLVMSVIVVWVEVSVVVRWEFLAVDDDDDEDGCIDAVLQL